MPEYVFRCSRCAAEASVICRMDADPAEVLADESPAHAEDGCAGSFERAWDGQAPSATKGPGWGGGKGHW